MTHSKNHLQRSDTQSTFTQTVSTDYYIIRTAYFPTLKSIFIIFDMHKRKIKLKLPVSYSFHRKHCAKRQPTCEQNSPSQNKINFYFFFGLKKKPFVILLCNDNFNANEKSKIFCSSILLVCFLLVF